MLLFADSFDHYATADVLKKWNSSNGSFVGIGATAGRRGGGAILLPSAGSGATYVVKVLPSSYNTLIVGVAFKLSALSSLNSGNGCQIFSFYDNGTVQCTLNVAQDGTLRVVRGATLLGTSAAVITVGTFYYIEFKVTFSTTVGTYDVHVNGSSVLSGSGVNTANAATTTAGQFYLGTTGSFLGAPVPTYDDLYICDTSGSTNNNFLGDVRIDCLRPNADGTHSDFAVSQVPGAHRFWRVNIAAVSGGGSYQIACQELELRLTSGGANQTGTGTASTSVFSTGNPASSAFDNNAATSWQTGNGTTAAWLAYDFGVGNAKDIREIAYTVATSNLYAPTDFSIQYSDDGAGWTTLWALSGLSTGWTFGTARVFTYPGGTPSHASMVDDASAVDAADYNKSATVGAKDTYAFDNLTTTSGTVYGVQVVNTMTKDDSGNRSASNLIRSSTTEVSASQAYLGYGSPVMNISVHETDPATTAAWTVSGINALEAGAVVSS
jgi:hypothetical protein